METINPPANVNLAILDRTGAILSVNDAWKRFARQNGLCTAQFGVGSNYLEHCEGPDKQTREAREQIGALLRYELDLVSFVYRCDSPNRKRAFVLIGATAGQEVALLHVNVSHMLRACRSAEEIARVVESSAANDLAGHLAGIPVKRAVSNGHRKRHAAHNDGFLTDKEEAVLSLLAKGKTNKEIANLLSRSPNTIKIHVSHILKKLNLRSRTEAALLSLKWNAAE